MTAIAGSLSEKSKIALLSHNILCSKCSRMFSHHSRSLESYSSDRLLAARGRRESITKTWDRHHISPQKRADSMELSDWPKYG
jgi:hypothetical protein